MPTDAKGFFETLKTGLADAANETEVRDRFCREVYVHYGINFRLERGRSGARLNSVILEFKDKGLFRSRANSAKFKEAYNQLTQQYIPQQAELEDRPRHEYIGIVIDGVHYSFVFFEENGNHRHTSLLPIDADTLFPLLDALHSDVRRAFTVENLLEDFSSESQISKAVLRQLWGHLDTSLNPDSKAQKVKMLFQEWQKLFAQVTNLGRIGRARIDNYLRDCGFTPPLDHTRALFVLHTYNALLFKFIAGELVTAIRYTDYSGFASKAASLSENSLRDFLNRRIEHAEVFISNGIENFIEGTFFSWYVDTAPHALLQALRDMLVRLGMYIFPTSAQQSRIRDVVKALYQATVPEALRKNIGEFYTPEWLVDFVLDEAGYKDATPFEKRLLDPCCGSGNFLIHAIARCKAAARQAGESDQEILRRVSRNVVGFDLNPLAVISARLNYLLAIADILPQTGRLEIPVYMADAVYAPVRDERNGSPTRSYQIGTVLGTIELTLPEGLVQRRRDFGAALSIMERDVESQDSRLNFIAHLQQDGRLRPALERNPSWKEFLGDMFERICEMERRNWNRVWCRIVRNYFASVSIGKVDIVAGNPPWVRWSELPEDYRARIKPTCDRYAIFSKTPFFGGNELDISAVIAYTVTDKWLAENGILGFVITQIHFQAPSSEGFRDFSLPDGTSLGVSSVHDFTKVKPWQSLANKPAVFTWQVGAETRYPVSYKVWDKREAGAIDEDAPLDEVRSRITPTEMRAISIPPDGRWSILLPQHVDLVSRLQGGSTEWVGRKGITTDLNGAYFVEVLGPGTAPGLLHVRTTPDSGRKPVPLIDRDVEGSLLYPLLKGAAQISPFSYTPSELVAIVPNQVITTIPPENVFRRDYRETFHYFQRVNSVPDEEGVPLLEGRSTWKSRMKPMGAPFYAIYNVGNYTFSPYKVVWAEMAGTFAAAVVSSQTLPFGLGTKPIIPDHKIYFVSTENENAAHFLCAMMNSKIIRAFVNSFTVKIQVGTIFRHLRLPAYDSENTHHHLLSQFSRKAHESGITEDLLATIEQEAQVVVAAL